MVPFAARQFWSAPAEYEIWWEDPRDLYRVVVNTGGPLPELDYWRSSWPRVRVPKGAVVGAGESGWLANDDWTNGKWQPADVETRQEGSSWVYTFRPLNQTEFPDETSFPAAFRRTLKLRLRFPSEEGRVERVQAFTDSVWQEGSIMIEWRSRTGQLEQWDGTLQAYNGEIQSIRPLNARTTLSEGRWRSIVMGENLSGIRVKVRYATNEDRNSFDRTIVTLRSAVFEHGLPGVSFYMDDALRPEGVYIRDLGLLVRPARRRQNLHRYEKSWQARRKPTLYEQIAARSEQTWEGAWNNQPRKTTPMYFTLGGEGSRQKFGVEPTGDVFMTDTYIRSVPGKDTPRLDWQGQELRFKFGFPQAEPGDRSLLDGELPILRTTWTADEIAYEQEIYANWLWGIDPSGPRPGDDPMVALMRVRFHNLGAQPAQVLFPIRALVDRETLESLLASADGLVTSTSGSLRLFLRGVGDSPGGEVDGSLSDGQAGEVIYETLLPPGEARVIFIYIPHVNLTGPDEIRQLRSLDYAACRAEVAGFWRQRLDQGAQIETPNALINRFYRSHMMHMLVINDREPGSDRSVARCGGFYYGSFPDEGCMAILDLDRRGYHAEARRCLDLYLHYQGTVPLPGNFQSAEGVFYGGGGYEVAGYNRNHGWVLWTLVNHARMTGDRAWLEQIAPALVAGCDWIIRERQATRQPGSIQYGFLPSGSLEDVTDYWTWLATNAYAGWGFQAAAEALAEIGHPEAERIGQEAAAFLRDLRAGFFESCARSPVVKLRDGTWVPHFPARLERRGRDFGWLREVLEGACHLVYTGIIAPGEPAARWILQDYEDNLFLSPAYGYQAPDFERQWFDLGGFSMQSNLLLFPDIYLERDEVKHYLRGYFNAYCSAFFPDTMTMCEHALPDLAHWRGDHFKSSDEANSNGWLRGMFLAERGPDLWIGQALPREWFRSGLRMSIERAATRFGQASAAFESQAAAGVITARIDPPHRDPPRRILLRVRHPERKPMRAVWVNGLPHADFDPQSEVITLAPTAGPLEVRVVYAP